MRKVTCGSLWESRPTEASSVRYVMATPYTWDESGEKRERQYGHSIHMGRERERERERER